MIKTYHFKITLAGSGNTPEEAWNDACEAFMLDTGNTPEDYEIQEEVEEE
jgi:hypothetical protein